MSAIGRFSDSGGSGFAIRPMELADLPVIYLIERQAHSHPWRPEHFSNCLAAGNVALVVEPVPMDESKKAPIVAYALASVGGGEADLLNVVVAPEAQRRGIARALLAYLITTLQGRAENLFLEVRASNQAAIELYEQLGFNQVGSRRGYYPASGGREDALIMALSLPPAHGAQ